MLFCFFFAVADCLAFLRLMRFLFGIPFLASAIAGARIKKRRSEKKTAKELAKMVSMPRMKPCERIISANCGSAIDDTTELMIPVFGT